MRATLIAVLAVGMLGTPASASWAERADMAYPVYTGTNQALARANRGLGHYRYYGRHYRHHAYYRW